MSQHEDLEKRLLKIEESIHCSEPFKPVKPGSCARMVNSTEICELLTGKSSGFSHSLRLLEPVKLPLVKNKYFIIRMTLDGENLDRDLSIPMKVTFFTSGEPAQPIK